MASPVSSLRQGSFFSDEPPSSDKLQSNVHLNKKRKTSASPEWEDMGQNLSHNMGHVSDNISSSTAPSVGRPEAFRSGIQFKCWTPLHRTQGGYPNQGDSPVGDPDLSEISDVHSKYLLQRVTLTGLDALNIPPENESRASCLSTSSNDTLTSTTTPMVPEPCGVFLRQVIPNASIKDVRPMQAYDDTPFHEKDLENRVGMPSHVPATLQNAQEMNESDLLNTLGDEQDVSDAGQEGMHRQATEGPGSRKLPAQRSQTAMSRFVFGRDAPLDDELQLFGLIAGNTQTEGRGCHLRNCYLKVPTPDSSNCSFQNGDTSTPVSPELLNDVTRTRNSTPTEQMLNDGIQVLSMFSPGSSKHTPTPE